MVEDLEEKMIEVEKVASSLHQSLSETETSQGIIAVIELKQLPMTNSPNFILIPDSIRDPGNLGTLLRSADAADVRAVLIPPETTDAFSPKVVRAGMGAHFRLPIHSMNWDEIHQQTKNLRIFVADMNGQSCWETDFRQPLALIVGGEAEGASEQARQLTNAFVRIPMAG